MKSGVVKLFNEQKKIGFISCVDDGKEYYVHIKDLMVAVKTGDEVTLDLIPCKRGEQEVKVKKT